MNRIQINQLIDVLEQLKEEDADLQITSKGLLTLKVFPDGWWMTGNEWPDEKRHKILALLTPFVGKLNKEVDGTHIGYCGEKDNLYIRLSYVDKCKIVGYKTVTKTVKKEVEREPEYIEEEMTEQVPITDCAIREGKFSEDDIEVTT